MEIEIISIILILTHKQYKSRIVDKQIIAKYGIVSNDVNKIMITFANLINAIYNISNKADYNDVMNLCHNFNQYIPEDKK